jgi:hypothetical protein
VKVDERGIPLASLRLGDSASVAGQDYDEGMPRQDIVPGDSRSATGQTLASGMNDRGGAATTAGRGGDDARSQLPDGPAGGGNGPINDWISASQGDHAHATDKQVVEDWQTEARKIVDSGIDVASKNDKDRQDWWCTADVERDDLQRRFIQLSLIDQGVCRHLMTQVMQVVDDQEDIGQQGGSETAGAFREPLTEVIHGGEGALKEKVSSGQMKDASMGPEDTRDDQQNARNESSTLHPGKPPLLPLVRGTQEGQSDRPLVRNDGRDQARKGTWPPH